MHVLHYAWLISISSVLAGSSRTTPFSGKYSQHQYTGTLILAIALVLKKKNYQTALSQVVSWSVQFFSNFQSRDRRNAPDKLQTILNLWWFSRWSGLGGALKTTFQKSNQSGSWMGDNLRLKSVLYHTSTEICATTYFEAVTFIWQRLSLLTILQNWRF